MAANALIGIGNVNSVGRTTRIGASSPSKVAAVPDSEVDAGGRSGADSGAQGDESGLAEHID